MNIYFKDLFTNKPCEVYIYIACEKHFTTLQEIIYTIAYFYVVNNHVKYVCVCIHIFNMIIYNVNVKEEEKEAWHLVIVHHIFFIFSCKKHNRKKH